MLLNKVNNRGFLMVELMVALGIILLFCSLVGRYQKNCHELVMGARVRMEAIERVLCEFEAGLSCACGGESAPNLYTVLVEEKRLYPNNHLKSQLRRLFKKNIKLPLFCYKKVCVEYKDKEICMVGV